MSKGKGKEAATEPDWKEKLAMLDEELGWDEEAGLDWADSIEAEKQEVFTPNQPPPSKQAKKSHANISQDIEQYDAANSQVKQDVTSGAIMTECDYANYYDTQKYLGNGKTYAHYEPSKCIGDDELMSAEMQKTIWEAAVEEARAAAEPWDGTDYLYEDHDQNDIYNAPNHQEQTVGPYEEDEEEEDQEAFQPKSKLEAYLYHRFGPDLRYENRCSCHNHLHDAVEEEKQWKRDYFAQAGQTPLIKDPCVLLPYPQEDLPGTENVDKPVLMVTTPEGETLFPHDMEEYPEPPTASWHGPKIGWGGAVPQGENVVPYEDEDGADI